MAYLDSEKAPYFPEREKTFNGKLYYLVAILPDLVALNRRI